MEKTVEFKIRVPKVDLWEDMPVFESIELSGTKEEIEINTIEIAEEIAFSQHSKVRWNYEGQLHGHYTDKIFPDGQRIIVEGQIILLPQAV